MKKKIRMPNERKQEICDYCAKNLRVMRYYLNWKQEELASLVGTTHRRISDIETGKSRLPWTLYLALLSVFLQNPDAKTTPVYSSFVPEDVLLYLQDSTGGGRTRSRR